MTWVPPAGATEEYYASLPFATAQAKLAETAPNPMTWQLVTCEWHGTRVDPNRGSFAVVRADGPLAGLVGERLRVSFGGREVFVYVVATRAIDDDLSLARRAFAALAVLSTETLNVGVEVMS